MEGLGLALGGGGITGCSHVGVICALEEAGIPIKHIAGTSAGGLVAALYASGYTGRQLARMVPKLTMNLLDYDYGGIFFCLFYRKNHVPSMIRGRRLRRFLEDVLGDRTIRDLRLPVAITASDLQSARQVLFANGPMQPLYLGPGTLVVKEAKAVDAVLASMAIPGLFRPVRFGEQMLVDGGLLDNCPTASLKAMGARRLLAVNLVSVRPLKRQRWSFSSIMTRSLSIGLHRLSLSDSGYADLVLNPEVGAVGLLDFSSIPLCVERGYECARKRMDDILRLMEGPAAAAAPSYPCPAVQVPPAVQQASQANSPSLVH